jgi:DNA-binding NarL/FixJ family response regulator
MDTPTALEPGGYLTMDRSRKTINVLLIDPRPFTRACTSAGLIAAPDFSVEGFESLAAAAETVLPDLVLLQDRRADNKGPSLTEEIGLAMRRWPNALILVVAKEGDTDRLIESMQCGVGGVLSADTNLQALISAIRLLAADLAVYPKEAVSIIRNALFDGGSVAIAANHDAWSDSERFHRLTPRQQEVLRLLALGMSNRKIASMLDISESTVKVHIRSIMTQTGVTNRTQIVAQYMSQKP